MRGLDAKSGKGRQFVKEASLNTKTKSSLEHSHKISPTPTRATSTEEGEASNSSPGIPTGMSMLNHTGRRRRDGPRGYQKRSPKKNKKRDKAKDEGKTGSWHNLIIRDGAYKEDASLDKSNKEEGGAEAALDRHARDVQNAREKYLGDEKDGWDDEDEEDDGDDEDASSRGWFSTLRTFGNRITGKIELTEEVLDPVLRGIRERLVTKNVAMEVAASICDSVRSSLSGTTLGGYRDVQSAVKQAVEESVSTILTPKKSIDIVRDVQLKKETGEPFVITFIGVNGVGKSTSLAKVCYFLMGKGMKPLIAACDTFRSGAVEQLRVHSDCLGVEVFDQGYSKDAAGVAKEAIKYAKENGYDIVLVDTAGRMQNNRPLMVSLSKLIAVNKPDLVLFVGEALVGNDSIDQLQLFNRALLDNATVGTPRLIDGIVLTKFDCVDDKVGTAVSMVYKTGQPIIFVGTGQKYTHLRRLSVRVVTKMIFRD